MFTGIIEAQAQILKVSSGDKLLRIEVQRPEKFQDISIGDSIACDGVCLTVDQIAPTVLGFSIGYETLHITGWSEQNLTDRNFNLERSLQFGSRIHGHLVSGHVDCTSQVIEKHWEGECLLLSFSKSEQIKYEIWKKSCIAINGVSLTLNEVDEKSFKVCLIPETLKETNLKSLAEGDFVNIETDYYFKGLLQAQEGHHA